MKVWHFTPYSTDRNLGRAYNEYMALIPEGDAACFMDGDAMYLIPDWGHVIENYANTYPNAILTCWINRIHELAKGQNAGGPVWVDECLRDAVIRRELLYKATPITGSVSGTLLVIPKSIWQLYPFSEVNTYRPGEPNLLGVDNEWTNRIRANGVQVLRMDGMLIYHQYRLLTGKKDHLL